MKTLVSAWQDRFQKPDAGVILRVFDGRLAETTFTANEFKSAVERIAGGLKDAGVRKGDHVFLSLTSEPEMTVYFWASVLIGAVPCLLFTDYGADALSVRFRSGAADVLILDQDSPALSTAIDASPGLRMVLRTEEIQAVTPASGFEPDSPESDAPAFMIFTSGSTGFPKAVLHRQGIAGPIFRSMKNVLGVQPGETYWCTAHPAWITGTVYAVIGPILANAVSIRYTGAFHARRWLPLLESAGVSTFYTAPSALRGLMRMDDKFFTAFKLEKLRAIFSVGEPLSEAVYEWGMRVFGQTIYDTWFQSEAGTIRIANRPGDEILPGWMGRATDDAGVALLDDELVPLPDGVPVQAGKLALRRGWDGAFLGYAGRMDLTASKFSGEYYLSGDLAARDEKGRFKFIGRDDDIINTSGHLLGPFEVESVLTADASVADAAVVSVPDPLIFEAVAVVLVLKEGAAWSEELELRLKKAVTAAIAPYAAPKRFIVVDALPRNDAGKILRRQLRENLRNEKSEES